MIQINKHSKRKRKIRRLANASPYPVKQSSEDINDSDQNNPCPAMEVEEALDPKFLAAEVPGTSDLLNQVNSYKKNAENSEHVENALLNQRLGINGNEASSSQVDDNEHKSSKLSQSELSSSEPQIAVAIVNGKPWHDSRPPHTPKSKLKPVPGIEPLPKVPKPKRIKRKGGVKTCPEEVISILEKYTEVVEMPPDCKENCIICCESLSDGSSYNNDKTLSRLTLCSHVFHKACIEAMYDSGNKEFLQCPTCKKIHGEKCGIQPPGEMVFHVLPYSLPGHPEHDTIRIIYDIPPGIQGPEHPHPGRSYSSRGFPRHCYLPDNEIGRKILRLLIKAWKRRLIFTIGRSSTTGEENTVTWNEIHHKTEFGYNRRGHGYPDTNYFTNVLAELEAHGVIDDEVRVWQPV